MSLTTIITPQQDWRAYLIPWTLQPAPPWDSVPTSAVTPWPPYSPVTIYTTTHWPNALIPPAALDPFHGWVAQDEPPTMRPAVPGLTSP